MLEHEKDIKHDGKKAEPQFGGVTKEGAPIIIVVGDDKHLADAEDASGEVEHDVADAPSDCALPAVVHIGLFVDKGGIVKRLAFRMQLLSASYLGHILDECDGKLHIGAGIHKGQPCDHRPDAEADEHYEQQCCYGQESFAVEADLSIRYQR